MCLTYQARHQILTFNCIWNQNALSIFISSSIKFLDVAMLLWSLLHVPKRRSQIFVELLSSPLVNTNHLFSRSFWQPSCRMFPYHPGHYLFFTWNIVGSFCLEACLQVSSFLVGTKWSNMVMWFWCIKNSFMTCFASLLGDRVPGAVFFFFLFF